MTKVVFGCSSFCRHHVPNSDDISDTLIFLLRQWTDLPVCLLVVRSCFKSAHIRSLAGQRTLTYFRDWALTDLLLNCVAYVLRVTNKTAKAFAEQVMEAKGYYNLVVFDQ